MLPSLSKRLAQWIRVYIELPGAIVDHLYDTLYLCTDHLLTNDEAPLTLLCTSAKRHRTLQQQFPGL
jgi:hypothetical protein